MKPQSAQSAQRVLRDELYLYSNSVSSVVSVVNKK
jgi:hypothetical protein